MKYYLNGILLLIFIIVSYFNVLPTMISAKDTIIFIGGITYGVIICPMIATFWIKKAFLTNNT